MEEPKVQNTAKYSIKEAAKILQKSKSTLQRHANEGLIKYGISRTNGRRFVTGEAIKRYWRISI